MRRAIPTTRLEAVAQRIELDVSYAARRPWVPSRGQFARWAAAALAPAGGPVALSVRVVGRACSRSLNARYRHKDKATNVLSFSGVGTAPDGRQHLGELVICTPVVAQEARIQGKSLLAHWAHMTVHGVLHLRGFDHESRREFVKMAAAEIQILDRLGFSDPYR